MTFDEVERLLKLGREMNLSHLSVNGLVVNYNPAPATPPAISGQQEDIKTTGEPMPTDDQMLFASVGGLDIEAKPPTEDAA